MRHRLILTFACAALSGCAGLSRPDLPVCDGAGRRPANPHGSILAPSPPPPAPATASAAAPTPAPTSPEAASGGCA